MAREVLLLRGVQDRHWHQVLHPTGAGDILHWLLRGEVRNALHQVRKGRKNGKNIFHIRLYVIGSAEAWKHIYNKVGQDRSTFLFFT